MANPTEIARGWVRLSLLLLFAGAAPLWAQSTEIPAYLERFALHPEDRPAVIRDLPPGTPERFYYEALHLQHTRDTKALDALLARWHRRDKGKNKQRTQIELREALLRIEDEPERSFASLEQFFASWLDDQNRNSAPVADLPTRLDPALVAPENFLARIDTRDKRLRSSTEQTLAWVVRHRPLDQLSSERLVNVLHKVSRPDFPKLVDIYDRALKWSPGDFGKFAIHGQLLAPQLAELVKRHPDLATDRAFIRAQLVKLHPLATDSRSERLALLERQWQVVKALPPAFRRLKQHILYHQLVASPTSTLEQFRRYVEQRPSRDPRQNDLDRWVDGNDPFAVPTASRDDDPFDLSDSGDRRESRPLLRSWTGLEPPKNSDELALVRRHLLRHLRDATSPRAFAEHFDANDLAQIFAEAQATSPNSKTSPEVLASALGERQFSELRDRVDLEFAEQPTEFPLAADDPVEVKLWVKNVPELHIRVHQLDPLGIYQTTGREFDLDLPLDSLTPMLERKVDYSAPPLHRHLEAFAFPELAGKRGAWVIDFIGGAQRARFLVRKGSLRAIHSVTEAGVAVRIFDENLELIPEATIWKEARAFKATPESGGVVLLPFSAKAKADTLIITDGETASLATYPKVDERYRLEIRTHSGRESLIAGAEVPISVRPRLFHDQTRVPLSRLENARLEIDATLANGSRSLQTFRDIPLSGADLIVQELHVPERLQQLAIYLTGNVERLSDGESTPVSARSVIQINGLDTEPEVLSGLFVRDAEQLRYQVFGKNGEPVPDHAVTFRFQARGLDSDNELRIDLRTDEGGSIDLGAPDGIAEISAQAGSSSATSRFPAAERGGTLPPALHARTGEPISLPFGGALTRATASLLSVRGKVFIGDHFDRLSANGSILTIAALPPGTFLLTLPELETSIPITVAAQRASGLLHDGKGLFYQNNNTPPLAIEDARVDGDHLLVKVAGASPSTRLHLYATHFEDRAGSPWRLSFDTPAPRQMNNAPPTSLQRSGRPLGSEYGYVIARRSSDSRFPGNMLPRPSLLLNPRDTGTNAATGSSRFLPMLSKGVVLGDDSSLRGRAGGGRFGGWEHGEGSSPNLDFLAVPAVSLSNLKPADDGTVRIPLNRLADRHHLSLLATSARADAWMSVALPAKEAARRDLRLSRNNGALPPAARFAFQRQTVALEAGQAHSIEAASTARIAFFQTLGDVFDLYRTLLGGDGEFIKFHFITRWPEIEAAEQRALYSEFACHELDLFLYHKDRAFFDAVVAPHLRNKRSKRFIDHYLLGDDLTRYTSLWEFGRLNAAEKALLARTLPAKSADIGREMRETIDARGLDLARRDRLFFTTLGAKSLSLEGSQRLVRSMPSADASGGTIASGGKEVDTGRTYLLRKLRETIIPSVIFDEATVEEALHFLRQKSIEHDPFETDSTRKGVNMLIRGASSADYSVGDATITLSLKNVPLADALQYVADLSQMKYKVEPNAVVLVPVWEDAKELYLRTFRVPPNMFAADERGNDTNAQEFLQTQGITFPEGASAFYNPRTSTLVLRNTQSNMELAEVLLSNLSVGPSDFEGVSDDPFAAADPFALADADPFGADPFSAPSSGLDVQRPLRFYRTPGATREWLERDYWRLPPARAEAALIAPDEFWHSVATTPADQPFLPLPFPEAADNLHEALLALALIDLPFAAEPVATEAKGDAITITPSTRGILVAESLVDALPAEGSAFAAMQIVRHDDPYQFIGDKQLPKYVRGDFLTGTIYTCETVVGNTSGQEIEIELLRQIPRGAMPVNRSPVTSSESLRVKPYQTVRLLSSFYFPAPGHFVGYPLQVTSAGKVIATSGAPEFHVKARQDGYDRAAWEDVATRGTAEEITAYLGRANLSAIDIHRIEPRLSDIAVYRAVLPLLARRGFYDHRLYRHVLVHRDSELLATFLKHDTRFTDALGNVLSTPPLGLELSPERDGAFHVSDFDPLHNARAHPLRGRTAIPNERVAEQYRTFLQQLALKATPDATDHLAATSHLLLQDRVADAKTHFAKASRDGLDTKLQHDYFSCYFAFSDARPEAARAIAERYRTYPVDHWRERFAEVLRQADQIAGEAGGRPPKNRDGELETAAASAPTLAFESDGGTLRLQHRNTDSVELRFFPIDLELLFSESPFDIAAPPHLGFVVPHAVTTVDLADNGEQAIAAPEELRNRGVYIEARSSGTRASVTHAAHSLRLETAESAGLLTLRAPDGKLLPNAYIKVYVSTETDGIRFHKDGYTDLRGKFDYASVSGANENIARFAILVVSKDHGTLAREVDPPLR